MVSATPPSLVKDHTFTFLGGTLPLAIILTIKILYLNFYDYKGFFFFLLINTHMALRLWKFYALAMNGEIEISVEISIFTSNLIEK